MACLVAGAEVYSCTRVCWVISSCCASGLLPALLDLIPTCAWTWGPWRLMSHRGAHLPSRLLVSCLYDFSSSALSCLSFRLATYHSFTNLG